MESFAARSIRKSLSSPGYEPGIMNPCNLEKVCNSGLELRSQESAIFCASPEQGTLDFVSSVQKANVFKFGAFRSDDFAQNAEKARQEALQHMPENFAELPFAEAAASWMEEQTIYHEDKPKTLKSYADYIKRLSKCFGALPLNQIHVGHLRQYQKDHKPHYTARSVNHDIALLSRILRKAGLWDAIEPHYKPLPIPKWTPPRVLSEKEEEHLFEVAARNSEYSLAYWVASLTNNTSASGAELRGLRLKHVRLDSTPPILYVPSDKVKNEYRARVIPLNERGATQLRRIVERANSIGSTQPEHYLFPFRARSGKPPIYDPTRPASESFLRKQWNKMRREAGFPKLRPHDLRHQIITKLLENGVPEQTVMSIAGHVSREMLEHYSHQRVEAKFRALDVIDPDRKKRTASVENTKKGATA